MRVLIVDDYPDAAEASRMLIELLGHDCRAVTSGTAAIETAVSFDPDVVLLDIGLPDVSGYDVARAIRARTRVPRVFIAAITGWAAAEDRVKSLAAGIDTHVLKPPKPNTLEEVLRSAAARRLSESVAPDED